MREADPRRFFIAFCQKVAPAVEDVVDLHLAEAPSDIVQKSVGARKIAVHRRHTRRNLPCRQPDIVRVADPWLRRTPMRLTQIFSGDCRRQLPLPRHNA